MNDLKSRDEVAILILLELTLQLDTVDELKQAKRGRNPYFIGINSAIELRDVKTWFSTLSQSLFYWN